ncbi:MAG: excinuclease ABC subunit UvrC [Myxococcota bacterium]|nr:excinuclease ABC subunit UvrC [Myxococcota bacterium]MEC9439469.1 excinuclease ABC subunit UvrC [Myxococcota bacterium]
MFDHQAKLEFIPHEPGCYLMKDKQGRIIYIGKAKDLKNRVRNYFQPSGDPRPFVKILPHILGDIETIITSNEKEALILESTLIKLHKPRYNIQLKDDKNYASLRIDTKHAWPRVEIVRKQRDDGAKYFGPYSSGHSVRHTIKVLNKHFNLRTCSDSTLENRSRPCLQYQIKRCPGPCVFEVDKEGYDQNVQDAVMFLSGKREELIDQLEEQMYAASEEMEFERAANLRDQISSIKQVLLKQRMVTAEDVDRDAFGLYREGEAIVIQLMTVRKGRLEGSKSYPFKDQDFPDGEVLSSFINVFYNSNRHIPDEVLLPLELEESEREAFEEMLTELRDKKVKMLTPKRGKKFAIVETANTNAKHAFEEKHDKETRTADLLEKLQNRLGLQNLPEHIECYDISNFQGSPIVGSQVVFIDGEPEKKMYRTYKMKEVTSQDDFASMHELLTRRLKRVAEGEDDAPDLIVIDGGKGQLGQAVAVLEDLGLAQIDVIGLAKSRVDKVGFEDEAVTRSPERVFLPGRKNPVILKQNSAELFLLQRLRDEAHRKAITYHKQLRRKKTLRSSLDDIPGVGKYTKSQLLKHFKSLKKIREATLEELSAVEHIGPKTAQAIFDFFNETRELE